MKKIFLLTIASLLSASLYAQESKKELLAIKMKPLEWLEGKWKGEGWIITKNGKRETFQQTEDIQYKLDDTIIQIEGVGIQGNKKIHNAMAIVYYDPELQKYSFKSFTADRGQAEAEVEVKPNTFIWKLKPPHGIIRYTITINDKSQWFEIGEISKDDGVTWNKFFEMTLSKVDTLVSNERK